MNASQCGAVLSTLGDYRCLYSAYVVGMDIVYPKLLFFFFPENPIYYFFFFQNISCILSTEQAKDRQTFYFKELNRLRKVKVTLARQKRMLSVVSL